MDETERRRKIQDAYNKEHNITPKTVKKAVRSVIEATKVAEEEGLYEGKSPLELTKKELKDYVRKLEKEMKQAAGDLQLSLIHILLDQYEDDKFPGGTTIEYTIENNGVRLEMDNAKLENFSKSDYNDIVKKMKNGDISIKKYDSGDIASLGLSHVKVTEQ